MNVADKLLIVGLDVLSIEPLVATIDSGLLTGTISSVSTLPLTDEKSTLNVLASGVTFALELIVNVLEKAAKPNVKPTTATQSATTAITLELLSIFFTSLLLLIMWDSYFIVTLLQNNYSINFKN